MFSRKHDLYFTPKTVIFRMKNTRSVIELAYGFESGRLRLAPGTKMVIEVRAP